MTAFHIVPLNEYATHKSGESWPCCFCWGKRVAMTNLRDHHDRPICEDCASRSVRQLTMPSFVRNSIGVH